MDFSFESPKRELKLECEVEAGLFLESLERLSEFMAPLTERLSRQQQRDHAVKVVRGLCSGLERKNAKSIACHFGGH